MYNLHLFWNHTWYSVKWGALYTEILDVNLFAFAFRLFHEDFMTFKCTKVLLSGDRIQRMCFVTTAPGMSYQTSHIVSRSSHSTVTTPDFDVVDMIVT